MEEKLRRRREQVEALECRGTCRHREDMYSRTDQSCYGCRALQSFQTSIEIWEGKEELLTAIWRDKPELDGDWLLSLNPLPST